MIAIHVVLPSTMHNGMTEQYLETLDIGLNFGIGLVQKFKTIEKPSEKPYVMFNEGPK